MAVDVFSSLILNPLTLRLLYTCRTPETVGGHIDWYLDHEDENVTSSADATLIHGGNFQGWKSSKTMFTSDGYKVKTLKRISDTAVEGRFICGDFQKWESAIALLSRTI